MSTKIRRVKSNHDSDAHSLIVSGNLYQVPNNIDSFEDNEEVEDNDNNEAKVHVGNEPCSLEDYTKAINYVRMLME